MATSSQLSPVLALVPPQPQTVSTPLTLKANAIWTVLGNGTYATAQWLQLALLARLGTPADVGRYAFATAIATPVFMLFNLQLRSVQATDSQGRYSFPEYLTLRALCSTFAVFAIVLLALATTDSGPTLVLTISVGLFKSVESISDIYQGLLQQSERMDCVGRSFLLKSVLLLLTFSLGYCPSHNILVGAGAMLIGQVLALVMYDVRVACRVGQGLSIHWITHLRMALATKCKPSRLLQLGRHALPLGVSMMLVSLYSNMPRFVVKTYSGTNGVGIFAAITCLSLVGGLLVTAVGTAVSPRLAQYASRNMPAYKKLLMQLLMFSAFLGASGAIISCFWGSVILRHLYGPEYALHNSVLVWTMLAGALTYCTSAIGFGVTAMGCFKEQPWIVGSATGVLLLSSYRFVPMYGLNGAAIAVFMAAATSLLGYGALLLRRITR